MTQPQDRAEQQFDELDRRLIAELQGDARIAYASLGSRLGVTGMTAANRLQRLRQSGLLHVQAVPNLPQLGLGTDILGLAQVEMAAIGSVIDSLVRCPHVLRLDRVTGEFDIAFHAVFPSDAAMGDLVREVQSADGVRRMVIHHVMDVAKADDGWGAVFAGAGPAQESAYELAPGATIPARIEPLVYLAASWVNALAAADMGTLHGLSTPDILFEILPPHPSAGRFDGIAEVEEQARRTRRAYNRLWYRIVSVTEHPGPLTLVIDALSPVESHRGRVSTAFSRMAFAFASGRVKQVMSVGQMRLPDVPTPGD